MLWRQHCIGLNDFLMGVISASKPLPQCTANVAVGSKCDIGGRLDEVCFTPMNGHRQTAPACPFGCCVAYRLRAERSEGLKAKGNEMRIVVASLIVLVVLYFWDQNYNNGKLLDGLDSMRRSISHQVFN